MARYRLDTIADLARQMAFTPAATRAAQLTSAETLLHDLDPSKAYPYDFVLFRITGYHPKHTPPDSLLTGLALQHDLGLLIEKVSDSLNLPAASAPEPVLSIDDVTERFNVTSKTIQRWRRKGLPARRFLFPDGKRRVGFLLSSVERFVRAHTQQVAEASNFSQVDDAERTQILRRARRLATQCGCCQNEIARRIAARFRRSPLTVLHTIRKHDADHPASAIFPLAPAPIADDQRASILRWHRRGIPLKRIARKLCRPTTAVYRVLIEERLARLNRKTVKFIDDPLYHQPDAPQIIDALLSQDELPTSPLPHSPLPHSATPPRDLPPYLQSLYRTPLLTPARERALFLKLNFHKYQFVTARRQVDEQAARARDLTRLESLLQRATDTKNDIVRANLRLVVSVARKHLRPGLSLMELVSDGNLTLLRAVDSFDTHKGNRFSTYATYALMTGFARSVPAMQAAARRAAPAMSDPARLHDLPDSRLPEPTRQLLARDHVAALTARLSDRERTILLSHYGLTPSGAESTYDQLATRLRLSPHRIRQIEQQALTKLRRAAATTSPAT